MHPCVLIDFMCCLQIEECLTSLKKLSPAEAECVIERLTSWARGHLQDKNHISEDVSVLLFTFTGQCFLCLFYSMLYCKNCFSPTAQETSDGHC